MTTRWWAPAGPHIGPDERDFELLIPLDNSRHDLGAALLALHRVGAAACEEVALHAIPDEVSLVSALATARQAFAAPLVESVSKSIGEGPYAGLLVRDTIDDAESAALLVFRTLTSSGVPAAVAAQRAGMVYGVPEDGLTSYLSVAKELRAHPAALNDAADRALFTAIEKISLEESVDEQDRFEEVSKTRPRDEVVTRREVVTRDKEVVTRDDPATPYYDARDAEGKFARGSVTGPPEVGEAPVKRVSRVNRVERVQRVERTPARPAAARPSRRKSRRREMKRDVARLSRTREPRTAAEEREIVGDLSPVEADGDFMAPISWPKDAGPFEQLDHDIAIAMSLDEWQKIRGKFGRDEDGRPSFRMGHLASQREVDRFGYASQYETDEHRKKLKGLAAAEHKKFEDAFPYADIVSPVTVVVTDDELANLESPVNAQDYVAGKKFDALVEHFTEMGVDPYAPEVRDLITMIISNQMKSNRSPDDQGDVYTYLPRSTGNSVTADIKVVELVFEPGVRGRDDGNAQHSDYALDANQIMRLENTSPELIYDPQIEAFRLRYYVNPDVSKADDYLDEHHVTNGPAGRFVATGQRRDVVQRDREVIQREDTVTPSAPVRRVERVNRTQRVQRPTPIQGRAFGRPKASRRVSRREQSRRLQRQLQEIEATKHSHPLPKDRDSYRELFTRGNYRVLDRDTMNMIEEHSEMQPGDDGIYVFDPSHKSTLLENKLGGREADYVMRTMTDRMILGDDDERGLAGAMRRLRDPAKPLDPTSDDFVHRVHDHMDSLFRANPELQQIQVFYDLDGAVSFLGNMHAIEPVVLVEVSDNFDPDQPFRLEFDTSIGHDQLIPDFDDPMETNRQLMSSLHYDSDDAHSDQLLPLKITRPHVDIYRLENLPAETDDDF